MDISIEKVRELTNDARETNEERMSTACDEAFEYITATMKDKILESAKKGKTRTLIYEWEFLSNPDDETYSFNGIRILEILKQTQLINNLRDFVNAKSKHDKFYLSWQRLNKEEKDAISKYAILVSWAEKPANTASFKKPIEKEEETETEPVRKPTFTKKLGKPVGQPKKQTINVARKPKE